jgi:hypothetical protein
VTALALSAALAGGALVASPTPTSAQQNAAQFCKEIGVPDLNQLLTELAEHQVDVSITQGACVSLVQAGNPTAAAASFCKDAAAQGVSEENRGECVREVKAVLERYIQCFCAPVRDDLDARELA